MDQSKTVLYKNSLYIATGIFVFLMCIATSSPAHGHRARSDTMVSTTTNEIRNEIPELGRFVVTPSTARYVPPSSSALDEQSKSSTAQGAM